jgi:hypothetical protein
MIRWSAPRSATPELRDKARQAGAAGVTAATGAVLTWLDSLQSELEIAGALGGEQSSDRAR